MSLTVSHTMKYSKIAVSIPTELLIKLDRLVKNGRFPNRSFAIQTAIANELKHIERTSLAYACSLASSKVERTMSEEGISEDFSEWPEY
jgi:metal-responsive CopG/Arc/MetJ family transcriptional regulator